MRSTLVFLLVTICCLLQSQNYNKQNTYVDALELTRIYRQNLKLRDSSNQNLVNAFYIILEKYGINSQNIESNPFIASLEIKPTSWKQISLKGESARNAATSRVRGLKANLPSSDKIAEYHSENYEVQSSSQSISWEASVINGMSSFMASRFKQEVLHMGINQMFAKITSSADSNLCRYLFPKSYRYIHSLYEGGNNSYYTSDLMILRESALIDIDNLPLNIVHNSDHLFSKIEHINKTKDILLLSHQFIINVKNGYALDRLIHSLTKVSYTKDSNVFRMIQLVDLISQATLNKSGKSDYWVSFQNQ